MAVKKVWYDLIPDTIIGSVWLAITKAGIITIDFDLSELEFVKRIRKTRRISFTEDKRPVQSYNDQIKAYLDAEITDLDLSVDLSGCTPFQRKVLLVVKDIPFGQLVTYSELAKQVDEPNAFRAVGQVLRRNPVPIAVPCHRVVHSDGTLGGYGGAIGSKRKIKLLKLEGAILT